MFGFTWSEIGWFLATCIVGAVMWATQVGPNDAVSNLSEWARKCGIKDPPAWLRARITDRRVRRGAAIALGILLFLGGMGFQSWRSVPDFSVNGTKVELGPRKREAIPSTPIPTSVKILFGPTSVAPKELQSQNVEWQAIEETAVTPKQFNSGDPQAVDCLLYFRRDECWTKHRMLELVLSFQKPITFKNVKIETLQGGETPKWTQAIMTETDAVLRFEYYPEDKLLNIQATD
jgi:hypothetical protein